MINFINTHDMNTDESREFLKQHMELEEFFDYVIAQIYFANTDWPGNNIKYWRPRNSDGVWRWMAYDMDATSGILSKRIFYDVTELTSKEKGLPDQMLADLDGFLQMLRPVVHIIFEDYIAKRLNLIDKSVKKKYKPLNERWIELNKTLS